MIGFNFSQPAQVHRVNLDDVITTHLITCVYVKLDIMAKTVIKVRKQLLWILDDEKLEDIKEVSRSRKSKMDNTMAKRKRTNNDLQNTTQKIKY